MTEIEETMFAENLYLVSDVLHEKCINKQCDDYDDLYQDCMIALANAIKDYNGDHSSFAEYAKPIMFAAVVRHDDSEIIYVDDVYFNRYCDTEYNNDSNLGKYLIDQLAQLNETSRNKQIFIEVITTSRNDVATKYGISYYRVSVIYNHIKKSLIKRLVILDYINGYTDIDYLANKYKIKKALVKYALYDYIYGRYKL